MKIKEDIPQYDNTHFAVVDLGSNSFHLLITQVHENQVYTVNKVKRKVRLAAGLNKHLELSNEAINRGLDCLTLFSKHLDTIPLSNIRIVSTAALRIAKNRADFFNKANKILPLEIKLLSGKQEAETIYSGVAHTAKNNIKDKQLVIDIGGASTELIIGQGFTANKAISLDLGCVSYREKFFTDGLLTNQNFAAAVAAASSIVKPSCLEFIKFGWQSAVGSSGTIRALAEILSYQKQEITITSAFLIEVQQMLINCKTIENIKIDGLREDRTPVLASGLCILIALFDCLQIKELKLSTGALREGLLFEMLASQDK